MRDLIRQVVSAYQAIKLEGQGPGGYVQFSAQEPDSRQPVIIRVLPHVLGKDPQVASRFRALAQTIRQLNHPNVATVRDVGEKQGLPYIVVHAVERAQPLADKLDQPWAVDLAADVTMQIGQALEHALNKGLVHGSLSPAEISLQPDGRVVVGNFGMAQLQSLVGADATPPSPYTAPERVGGRAPDPRGDVYSLAAILYQLLTRRNVQMVQGQVLPPGRFNVDVPPAMDAALVKALSMSPSDRYPDVKAFLAALGAVVLAPAATSVAAQAQGVRCPKCGAEKQTGRFCRACGAPLAAPAAPAGAQQPAPVTTRPTAPTTTKQPAPAASKPTPTTTRPTTPTGPTRRPRGGQPDSAQRKAPPAARPSRLDEPIQITRIDVGSIEMGKGVDSQQTTISTPLAVATGETAALFPEPLTMPTVDITSLSMGLDHADMPDMPELPTMPTIDWSGMVPPMPQVPTVDDIMSGQESR